MWTVKYCFFYSIKSKLSLWTTLIEIEHLSGSLLIVDMVDILIQLIAINQSIDKLVRALLVRAKFIITNSAHNYDNLSIIEMTIIITKASNRANVHKSISNHHHHHRHHQIETSLSIGRPSYIHNSATVTVVMLVLKLLIIIIILTSHSVMFV